MVKTRHSGDVDVETPPRFISLNNEKNRQSTRNSDTSENKLSHVYDNQRDEYNIFDEKVVESRLRPRIGPSRTYNYIDVDSSDEDSLQRQTHLVFTRSRQVKQEMLNTHVLRGSIRSSSFREDDADQSVDDDDTNIIQKRTPSVRLKESTDGKENLKDGNDMIRRKKYPSRHHLDEEDISRDKNSHSHSRGSEEEDDESGNLIRRSSRRRRQVYDTLNQSYLVSIPGQKKQVTEDNDHSDTKDDSEDNQEFSDMYSRVKRKRVRVKRNMYGIPVTEDSDSSPDIRKQNKNNSKDDEFESESQEDDGEDEKDDFGNTSRRVTRQQNLPVKKSQPIIVKSYSLREHKPRTDLYKAPLEERKVKKMHSSIFIGTPVKKNASQTYHSPAQRRNIRKRSAFHSSSSSTSSSDGESSDEKSFKRRKTKSMAKARSRLMPMNYSTNALPPNIVKDRIRSGSSLADVEPMKIDTNITFNSIGGLGKHIQALKEMVVFPLLYDKVFQRFNVDPPRGVLFYGPPGTGKTLVARALANECSKGDRRVAFFMRKGADCLSKWVGESERQLRILFDQAYKFRPSIIFFDEIDGLAPVRSSRQDQIHSSIVSTLLALMDGLDNRGEIVVIGATNRIDSLDPALRRPGRFDREFFFPLPSFEARKQILKIHTDSWTPKLNDHFISELAEKCVGYCGADLKSLCTEAAMLALRRRYPQIYMTNEALQIDVHSINISARDFFDAVNNIIPTAQRSVNTPARALPPRVQPLLLRQLNNAINTLKDIFPPCMSQTTSNLDATATQSQTQLLAANSSVLDDLISDEDDNSPSIFVQPVSSKGKSLKKSIEENTGTSLKPVYLNFTRSATRYPSTFRPRLMLVGKSGQCQTTYIAPAIIHKMENLPVHVLDLPALYAVTAKTPEESCANVFLEAKRKCPSIIYLPYINQWWDVMADTLKATLLTLIHDLNPSLPLLLLATSEQPYEDLDSVLQELFNQSSGEIIEMGDPNKEERTTYFRDLLLDQACKPPPQAKKTGNLLKFVSEHGKSKSQLFHQTKSKRGQKRKQSVSPLPCSSKKTNDNTCKMNASENIPLDSYTDLKEVKFSTHRMKLRPRINIGKLNRNHSAKEFKYVSECIVQNSKPHDPLNNQNILSTHSQNEFVNSQHKKDMKWHQHLKSARKGSSVSPRHERYVHRLLRHEKNLLKQDKKSYLPNTFSPTVYNDSQDQCCSYVNLSEDSTLSCGSFQMLYKKSDSKNKNISEIDEINNDYFLPINIKELKSFSRNSSNKSTHFVDEIAKNVTESLVKQTQCYNLRNKCHKKNALKMLEVLPKAAPPKPSELTKQELEQLIEKEELTLMELRIFLRDVLNKLGSDKKFSIFAKPVNIENAPDYYDIIEHPMDLSTMMGKIDLHEYGTVKAFMNDIDLICSNALEYNPNRGPMDRIIRHRACALKDTAYAIIKTELDKDFEKTCVEIEESRKRRGHKSSTVPNFYFTKPHSQQPSGSKSQSVTPNYLENPKLTRTIPKPEGERFSRRVRGLNTDPVPPLEAVEKVFKLSKSSTSSAIDEIKDNQDNSKDSSVSNKESSNHWNETSSSLNQCTHSTNAIQSKGIQILENTELTKDSKSQSSSSASKLKKKNKLNIWCKPRRKRTKFMLKTEQSQQEVKMDIDEIEQCHGSTSVTEISHPHSSQQLSEQLTIETTENDCKSARLKSPQISPSRIITRRSSMSPTNCTFKSTDPCSSSQIQDKLHDLLKKDGMSYLCDQTKLLEDKNNTELRKHGVTNETAEKPSAAKRLDLDSVVLDSGVGSSLDSNGDSRDSSDHSKTELSTKQAVINSVHDDNQNCNSELTSITKASSDESKKEVIIDKHRLTSLLNVLVSNTEGYNIEKLEKIYSQISHIIFNHRHNYNRNEMIMDIERKLEELIKIKISGPSSSFKK